MCQPFNYAQLDLGEMLSKEWKKDVSDFGLWVIQNEHGVICSKRSDVLWPKKTWPPLTPIGEILTADIEPMTSIMAEAEGNLILAKLRLEEICEADVLEVSEQVRDRLPRQVVSFFDAQIRMVNDQHQSACRTTCQAPCVAALGISAIKLATEEPDGISFEDLQNTLRASRRWKEMGPLDMQKVLHAAKGLLKVTWNNEVNAEQLEAYHVDFLLYASQRYNEYLENYKI
jgi:hypothetical protein